MKSSSNMKLSYSSRDRNTKYEFTGDEKVSFGVTFKRIKRISDGMIGGWIEKEGNLDIFGGAWVSGDTRVSGRPAQSNMKLNLRDKKLMLLLAVSLASKVK